MIYLVQNDTQTKFAFDYLSSTDLLGADTETTGLDPITEKVLSIQLGTVEHQFVFDIARMSDDAIILILLILTNQHIKKIFQNGKFDYKMLKSNFNIKVDNIADTMIMEQLLTKGVKKKGFGLDELSQKYQAGTLDKEVRSEFIEMSYGDEFSEKAIEYAANDVKVMPIIYNKQMQIAKQKDILDLVNLENETVSVMAEMELNGIYIDQKKWIELEDQAIIFRDAAEEKLQKFFEPFYEKDLFGKLDINYNSPAQIKPALEKVMKKTLTSTNEKYLKQLSHPVIDALMDYRQATKRITTYGKVFLDNVHPVTKRIHAKYLQLGTDSGRMSCTDPNMQNIPSSQSYRTPFCVENQDYRIISADFANQELRVLAQLSTETEWIKAIDAGRDLHSMVASMMFGIPEDQCQKDTGPELRSKAKAIGFGTIYGLSAHGLARDLKVDKKEAQRLLDIFFDTFPNIKRFLDERTSETLKNKCAISPLDGRIRDLSGLDWDDWRKSNHALNIGKNHPIQGASASITKLALVKLQKYINDNDKDAKIIAVIHDEILVECHKNIVKEMSAAVAYYMISAFNAYCPDIKMEVIPEISTHWIH